MQPRGKSGSPSAARADSCRPKADGEVGEGRSGGMGSTGLWESGRIESRGGCKPGAELGVGRLGASINGFAGFADSGVFLGLDVSYTWFAKNYLLYFEFW